MPYTHHHHGQPRDWNRAFAWGIGLNALFVVAEGGAGWAYGSLSLLADAGHNLTDVLGLLIAWAGMALSARRPTAHRTYGFSRASILAALLSALLVLTALGAVAWEAVQRLAQPVAVNGTAMIVVAGVGVVVNTATALLFRSGRSDDINLRGAYLHMAADAAVSLGVVAGGAAILAGGWYWLDPALSLVVTVLILSSAWGLLRESLDLAVDAVPRGIDPHAVERFLRTQPGVRSVHDLHIWGMSTTHTALTAHLVVNAPPADDALLERVRTGLHDDFGIEHVTVQVECGDPRYPCSLESAERV